MAPYSLLDYHPHNLGIKARAFEAKLTHFISSNIVYRIRGIEPLSLPPYGSALPLSYILNVTWWTVRESNPCLRVASAAYYHCTNSPNLCRSIFIDADQLLAPLFGRTGEFRNLDLGVKSSLLYL